MSDGRALPRPRTAARQARRRARRRLLRAARAAGSRSTPRSRSSAAQLAAEARRAARRARRRLARRPGARAAPPMRTCSPATRSPTATRSRAVTAFGPAAHDVRLRGGARASSTSCCPATARCSSGGRPGASATSAPATRRSPCSATCCRCCGPAPPRLIELPAGEELELEPVTDEPWWAFNYYQGNLRSRVVLNTDMPTTGLDLLHLAATRSIRAITRSMRSRSSC